MPSPYLCEPETPELKQAASAGLRVYPTVVHMLADTAARHPDRLALQLGAVTTSYRDYAARAGGLAANLQAEGAAGRVVVVILRNSIEAAVAAFGVHAAAATLCTANPDYTDRELGFILEDADPALVICGEEHRARVLALRPDLPVLDAATMSSGDGGLDPGCVDPAAIGTLQYTGGTTGRPKGAMLSHRAIATNIAQREVLLPTTPEDRILGVMPLFHVYAQAMCLHMAAYAGGALVLVPRYHPDLVVEAVRDHGVSVFSAGPTIYNGLLGYEPFRALDFGALRLCGSGSAPLSHDTMRRWKELTGCEIFEGYGQSEAGPVLTYHSPGATIKVGSVGPALPDTELQIVDVATGMDVLPVGEAGEIRARGPQIMQGYRNREEATAETLREGWLYTGDIGRLDEEGYLFIEDRKKDMIITGGYNVYPREIDEVLMSHPDVEEAACVGVPDDYRGEVIHAHVRVARGAALTAEALLDHARAQLAKYKLPAVIHLTEALPKTTVGKIDRKALRAAARDGTTSGQAA